MLPVPCDEYYSELAKALAIIWKKRSEKNGGNNSAASRKQGMA